MADLENQIRDLEKAIAIPPTSKNNLDPSSTSATSSQPTNTSNFNFNAPVTGQMQNLGGTITGGTFNFGTQPTPPPSNSTAKTTILFLSPYPSAAKLNITQKIQAISRRSPSRDRPTGLFPPSSPQTHRLFPLPHRPKIKSPSILARASHPLFSTLDFRP
jgi:hypothetical protein